MTFFTARFSSNPRLTRGIVDFQRELSAGAAYKELPRPVHAVSLSYAAVLEPPFV